MKKFWTGLFMIVLSLASLTANALDALSFQWGFGGDPKIDNTYKLGLQWDWGVRWLEWGPWYMDGYFEPNVFYIHTDGSRSGGEKGLYGASFFPMFRYQGDYAWFTPYIGAGIGLALITKTRLAGTNLSSNYQFDDRIAAGIRFGSQRQFDLAVVYNHYSNANLRKPNDGIDIKPSILFAYHFS